MATQQNNWDLGPGGWSPAHSPEIPPPQREAAFFYGLLLRGHSVGELRRDIAVPRETLRRWEKDWRREPLARQRHVEILRYRQQVLALFDILVSREQRVSHLRQ